MFAEINVQLLEPTVLYLDEKPPKIVQSKTANKKRERAKKVTTKKAITKCKVKKSKNTLDSNVVIKKELKPKAHKLIEQSEYNLVGDDPLYTPDKEIKIETNLELRNEKNDEDIVENKLLTNPILDNSMKLSDDEEDNNDFSAEEDDEYEGKYKQEKDYDDEYFNSDEDYDEEDEPLIMLTRSKGRPRKYPLKNESHKKEPRKELCRDQCKQQCTKKFSEEQRRSMCVQFWSLSKDDKVQFIRQHTKIKRYKRLKRQRTKTRGNNNYCYYLDDTATTEARKLTRVCLKYFEATLCLTYYIIKNALEGYQPEVDMDMKVLADQQKELEQKSKEKSLEIEQYLDPETGDLITIDPKAEKIKNSSDGRLKKKRLRRKPGDPLPEHHPKPIKCAQRCIHKCHTKFTEEERKQICDIFWSMDYKRRKDFILARIETREVETEVAPEFRKSKRPPRAYHTRFFLRSGINGENIRVCKHFMMATLAITRTFITNAIEFADKNTGCYTGADRRGQNSVPNKIGPDRKKIITDHIGSYATWIPNSKSKTRYLHHTLSIKRMHSEYKAMCVAQQKKFVSTHLYYKSFHDHFRLSFLSNPEPKRGGGFMKSNPNISHYTGLEPGGVWLDPKGDKLDISLHNPAESFMHRPPRSESGAQSALLTARSPYHSVNATTMEQSLVEVSSLEFNPTFNYAHLIDPALNTSPLNTNQYDLNLPHAHAAAASSLFRKL